LKAVNTLKKYICISCLFLFYTGCTKEFVDLKNPTIASPDVIYSTLDGIESSLPGIYAQGRAYCTWERGSEYKNGPDDLCRAGIRLADEGAAGDYFYYQAYSLTSFDAENTFVRAIWETYYLGLHKCNLALESLDNISIANPDEESRKNNASGVLYFFRAYFHLQLVQRFDNIVLADHVFNDPMEVIKLATKDEVYNLIVSDLEKAISLLPDEWTITGDKGHVTRGVARLVLAKACLDIGNWERAASAADSVIFNNGGAYRLVGLDTVFNCHFRDNAEFIFSWQINRPTSQTSMPVRFLPLYDRVRGVTRSFRYGGRPYDRLIPTDYYFSLFEKTDLRYQKWHILAYTYDTVGVGADNTEVPPPYVHKGDTVKEEDFSYGDGSYYPEQPGNEYINPTTNKWNEDGFFGRDIGEAYGGGNILQKRIFWQPKPIGGLAKIKQQPIG
jgi:hypothetical protein